MQKTRLNLVALIATIFLLSFTAQAQNAAYRNVVSFNAGYSVFNVVASAIKLEGSTTATASATPTFQANFDHGFNEWFSLGGAVSYNSAKSANPNFTLVDSLNQNQTGAYDANISRITVSARMLFHYGNKGKIDMYSGIRLGVGLWNSDVTSTISSFDISDLPYAGKFRNGAAPTIQFIPFALRGYLTDNIGLGFETAIGSPYMASIQLNYRLGGN